MSIEIGTLNKEFHKRDQFREQLAVFYVGNISDGEVTLLRSYLNVCLPGMASFDPERPGSDTLEGWKRIDNLIENQGVRGVFHTHPPGAGGYSGTDWTSMRAFAKAYGSRPLWYGVQVAGEAACHLVCLYMVNRQTFCFNYGMVVSDPADLTITVPLPPKIEQKQDMLVMEI